MTGMIHPENPPMIAPAQQDVLKELSRSTAGEHARVPRGLQRHQARTFHEHITQQAQKPVEQFIARADAHSNLSAIADVKHSAVLWEGSSEKVTQPPMARFGALRGIVSELHAVDPSTATDMAHVLRQAVTEITSVSGVETFAKTITTLSRNELNAFLNLKSNVVEQMGMDKLVSYIKQNAPKGTIASLKEATANLANASIVHDDGEIAKAQETIRSVVDRSGKADSDLVRAAELLALGLGSAGVALRLGRKRGLLAISTLALSVSSACAALPPRPVATEMPGSGITESLPGFNIEAQSAAVRTIMKPWEGKTLKDGVTLPENGTYKFIGAPNRMFHQTNDKGEQMPGMVTLAWADVDNNSTNHSGQESFLFFTDENGIPKQAVLLEFQESTLVNQLSANLVDENGNVIGHININHDLSNTEAPFASIQYAQATAVPGNPDAKLLNVVDLTFDARSTKNDKEQFWNALVAFTTGAEPAFAASGEVISVTPTAELATPTPTLPEAELSSIVTKVNGELSSGFSLKANPDSTYAITSPDGQSVKNILLRSDGKFYVTEPDGSETMYPPEVVFMPNIDNKVIVGTLGDRIYAGLDRIMTATGEVGPIPFDDTIWPTDPENQSPRITSEMLPQYEEWIRQSLEKTGRLDKEFAYADTSMRWSLLKINSVPSDYNRDGKIDSQSFEILVPSGTKYPMDIKNSPYSYSIPSRIFPSFVTLTDHLGVSITPVVIGNGDQSKGKYSIFPSAVGTDQINLDDNKQSSMKFYLRTFVYDSIPIGFYPTVALAFSMDSTVDGLYGVKTLDMFTEGKDSRSETERAAILQQGIQGGNFIGSSQFIWPLTYYSGR